jgi:CDP-diacylglycerol pyrophosphatase
MKYWIAAGLTIIVIAAGVVSARQVALQPNALWHVVHDLCVPNQKLTGSAAPCTKVDTARGYAILNDLSNATQLLVIPTDKITGIEDPMLVKSGSTNFWQAAWDSRPLFAQRVGWPVSREDIGMAVNSAVGRSQDQLHIHIDCVRPNVRRAVRALAADANSSPKDTYINPLGHRYEVTRVLGDDLGVQDPFKMLAPQSQRGALDSIAVIGASFSGKPGFVILHHRGSQGVGDNGHSEELLDHDCLVLHLANKPCFSEECR